jgi:hypothetical protein
MPLQQAHYQQGGGEKGEAERYANCIWRSIFMGSRTEQLCPYNGPLKDTRIKTITLIILFRAVPDLPSAVGKNLLQCG